jgi:hypothetical protein
MIDLVNNPSHYGGAENPYEAIKIVEAWNLGFCLGNVIKYVSRAGKKDNNTLLQDLEKARWYLDREIDNLSKGNDTEKKRFWYVQGETNGGWRIKWSK